MTRGRPSLQAIGQAAGIAAKRGVVIVIDPSKKSPFDLYFIRSQDIVAAKVKRARSRIREPKEIAVRFKSEIAEIRTQQLPSLVQREFWTLAPWGSWQFFLILNDRIIEISTDGAPIRSSLQDQEKPAPPGPPSALQGVAPRVSAPDQGFLCPFYAQVRE
ncbi:MAG: hypothetical protein CVV34_01710 [Methanomicrobiales archaeon HGW-Methanomicrobiales-5]|nr:MAG: hypothetical protein CVV34_01710 [Methanomicrobiales archaeon HGW-Methanomicrobiales-5]